MSNQKRLLLQDIFVGQIAGEYTSDPISLDNSIGFAIVASATETTLSNAVFQADDISLSTIQCASHGFATGLKVRFTTTGVLPTGLSLLTDYYLTKVTSDILLVSSSYANLEAGSYLTISADGSGDNTIVPQAAAPIYFKVEGSIDNETWAFVSDSLTQMQEEPILLEHEAAFFHWLRVKILVTSGQYDISNKIMIKGY